MTRFARLGRIPVWLWALLIGLFALTQGSAQAADHTTEPPAPSALTIIGRVVNTQSAAVEQAEVQILTGGQEQEIWSAGRIEQN